MIRFIPLKGWAVCILILASGHVVKGQHATKPDDNRFTKVVLQQKLEEPMQFQVLNSGKVLYAERKGKLKVYDPATNKMEVIAEFNVSREYVSKSGEHSEGEDGLQGVILDHDYAKNHWIYVYYSPKEKPVNRLSRFTWAGGKLDRRTEKVMLDVAVQREECCHVGGGMVFDKTGNLYLSTGDNTFSRSSDGFTPIDERPGESPRDAQKSSGNTNDLRGKILRIYPKPDGSYDIPDGNLFPKGTPKTRPEIYTMGNRNPWRLTIDSKTGWLFWGEVGPDGSNSSEQRGPKSYDEFNVAKQAGNYGWPYFIGKEAYRDYNFATKASGEWWDPAKPVNNSPNNTGLEILPPAVSPLIWYPYAASEEFPETGSGGRSAVGGPIFHQSDFGKTAKSVFPAYYEGKWLVTDWVRGWILAVTLDEQGNFVSMERFLPDLTLRGPIDMKFGPDGALYVLEYGNGYFKDNPEAELIKIEYNGGNRKPVVQVAASKTAGPLPLKVQLSSAGTLDADGDSLNYSWKITRNGVPVETNNTANPELTLTTAGVYKATLTVTDPGDAKNSKSVEISAGNAIPEVDFRFTQGNSSFFFPGNTIKYAVSVSDKEDGSLANKRILPAQVSVSINYLSEGYDMTVIAQNQNKFDASAAHAGAKALIKKSDCNACHALNTASLGPSLNRIAQKYKDDKTALTRLTKKVINGGSGVWGDAMMPAHSSMSTAEVGTIVKYILSLSEKKPAPKNLPVTGSYTTNEQPGQTNKGSFIFRAAYKDKGAKLAPAQQGESVVVLRNPNIPIADADETHNLDFSSNKAVATVKEKGAYVLLKQIDLSGVKSLTLTGTAKKQSGAFEVRLDNADGNSVSKSVTPDTAGNSSTIQLAETTGKHDVFIVFNEPGSKITAITVKNK
jgi:cytochrome c